MCLSACLPQWKRKLGYAYLLWRGSIDILVETLQHTCLWAHPKMTPLTQTATAEHRHWETERVEKAELVRSSILPAVTKAFVMTFPMTFSNSKTIDWRLAVFIKNSLQVTHRKGMKKKLMVFLYLKIFPWLKARPLSSLPTQHKYWFTNSLVCAASASSFFQSYEE